jgi:hypothetical protein
VTLWSLLEIYNVSDELTASIFYPEDRGSILLRNMVNLYQITRRNILEDSVLHNRCEKLKYRIPVNITLITFFIARSFFQLLL